MKAPLKVCKAVIFCVSFLFAFGLSLTTQAQPFPVNYFARVSPFQGQNIRIEINNINDYKNGKVLTYRTVLGLTLNDPSGIGVDEDYTEFALYVGTPDANLVSLDGASTIPLDRLEISASTYPGSNLTGIVGPPPFNFETFQINVVPVQNAFAEVFRSNRCLVENIVYSNHLLQLTFSLGITNKLENLAPGIYTLELQTCLCATHTGAVPGVCPPAF